MTNDRTSDTSALAPARGSTNSQTNPPEADPNPQPSRASRWLRALIQAVIVVFFGVMMILLVRDYYLPPDLQTPLSAVEAAEMRQAWRDYEEWSKIQFLTFPFEGASYVAVKRRDAQDDFAFTARYVLHPANINDEDSRVEFAMAARLTSEFTLDQFDLTILLPPGRRIEIRGLLDGQTLYYGIKSPDAEERIGTVPLKGQLAFLDGLQSMLPRQMKLEVGQEYRFQAFDPVWNFSGGDVTMKVADVEYIKVDNADYEVYRIEFKFSNFITTTWVTKDGEVIKRRVGNMLEMTRAEPKDIRQMPGFGQPITPPDYTADDFVLYMRAEDGRRRPGATGLFGLIGELLKAGNTP